MNILHTESSNGWGGQEIRILKEAEGMRRRGHTIFFAVARGGKLVTKAREKGFTVIEMDFNKLCWTQTLFYLIRLIRTEKIELINTHSSQDSWIGGIAGRMTGCKIIRTRHLSTPNKGGLNSFLLYSLLADHVVTTSEVARERIGIHRATSIPTGVEAGEITIGGIAAFREQYGILETDILAGSVCFVRSWKGINDLMEAALLAPEIKWMVIGGGYFEDYKARAEKLGVKNLIFTGHLDNPSTATASLDIFLLLSTAHEGVSQASLQAAFLKRPLVTTSVGGLPEVCLHGKTGLIVPSFAPKSVAEAVLTLANDREKRDRFGEAAHALVLERFTFAQTLDAMESVYQKF